jgi:O-antigen/teichoic acid export membrane protein
MADLAIIVIFNNILGGNSIVYFMPKVGLSKLILPAYLWIILASAVVAGVFTFFHTDQSYWILLPLTLVTSFLTFNLLTFIGKEKIQLFNIFSLMSPALLLAFNLVFIFLLGVRDVNAYLLCYFVSQLIVFLVSLYMIKSDLLRKEIGLKKDIIVQTFKYGWKSELSSLIQFLNYRLSYFFILFFQDIEAVGLFSVAIVVSESIWLMAKSITTVQYSKIVNLNDINQSVELTKKSAKISFYSTLSMLIVLAIIPASLFGFVFGKDFSSIKQLLFLLMPGILSIAVSNVYGHFFAAINQMKVLILKSAIGLVFTVVLSVILIPLWGLYGACIVTSVSYLSSSAYLFYVFKKSSSIMPVQEGIDIPDIELLN